MFGFKLGAVQHALTLRIFSRARAFFRSGFNVFQGGF